MNTIEISYSQGQYAAASRLHMAILGEMAVAEGDLNLMATLERLQKVAKELMRADKGSEE